MHGYETKEQKWNTQMIGTTPTGHPMAISQPNHIQNNLNTLNTEIPLTAPSVNDSKSGIQLINSTDCSSNGSVLMNGSNSNTTTLINPLINSGNGISILNNLTTFEPNDLRRPESVLSAALRSDTPSDLSGTSD